MNKLYISMYHYIRDLIHSRYPEIKGLDIVEFRHQIEYMKAHFNIVTMEQVIEFFENGQELPSNALLLTFDDGYVDNYTYAMPILEEMRVQGSFFISGKTFDTHELLDVNKIHYLLASADIKNILCSLLKKMDYYRGNGYEYPSNEKLFNEYAIANRFDKKEVIFVKRMLQTVLPEYLRSKISSELFKEYVGISEEILAYELYLSEEQIRVMKNHGMFIGVHGYDHYWLANLSKNDMKKDIEKAIKVLDPFIDKKHWVMNYPYGSYNEEVIDFIARKGAVLGLSTEVRVADLINDNRFILPRLDCNDFPPKSHNYKEY